MKGHGEAVRLVANLLDQVQYGRVMIENHRLILAAEDIEDFLFFGDAGHGLIDDGQLLEGLRRRMQLADAAVDQNQAGQRLVFQLEPAVAARDGFLHAGEIIA